MSTAALDAAGRLTGLAAREHWDPSLQRIRDHIEARPDASLVVVITGPGGSGKTSAADWIAEAYVARGQQVVHLHDRPPAPWPSDAVLIAEDAHLLDAGAAATLREVAARPGSRLVVTRRPWPETSELDAVVAAARRHGASVWLGHLTEQAVTALVEAAGAPAAASAPTLARRLHASTGGLPALVDLHLRGGAAQWSDGAEGSLAQSPAVVDYLRRELRHLSDPAVALLHALSVGAPWDTALLSAVLDLPAPTIAEASAEARASGLLRDDSVVVDDARAAVASMVAGTRAQEVQRRTVQELVDRDALSVEIARALAAAGTRDARLAEALSAAGWAAVPVDPAAALELFDCAELAGADRAGIAAGRAEAAAALGQGDAALSFADLALGSADERDVVRAATVSASVLTGAGLTDRAADTYQWLGAERAGWSAPLAAVTLAAAGRGEAARAFLAAAPAAVPTSLDSGRTLMARAILASLSADRAQIAGSLADLVRSATLVRGAPSALWPASPSTLGALLALHLGEPATAEALLERETSGPLAVRHLGLLSWAAMLRGNLAQASALLDDAGRSAGSPQNLTGRDALFAVALRAGIARRGSDPEGMRAAWAQARESLLGVSTDLYLLLPLGELAIVGARLGEADRLAAHLAEADALLAGLGQPPAWGAALHWARFHAAIAASDPEALAASAAMLVRASATLPLAAALARAGRCWTQLLSGHIDADAVIDAAHELQAAGLAWDGSRLAGQAAAQATDRRAMHALLQCARGLATAGGDGSGTAGLAGLSAAGDAVRLSDREREVAELVLAGKTYRQIGDQLFIAAKTVEHHVARIRQRLGATSRSDLFARLRSALAEADAPGLRVDGAPDPAPALRTAPR